MIIKKHSQKTQEKKTSSTQQIQSSADISAEISQDIIEENIENRVPD